MRSRQIPRGHEEFVDDLAAGEDERLLKQLCPFISGERVAAIEPVTERSMLFLQLQNPLRVDDGRVDLESIPNDAGIVEQTGYIFFTVLCYLGNIELVIRLSEMAGFFQNGDPGQARLIDLQYETFKEQVIILERKAILGIMIGSVKCIFWMRQAVITIAGQC